jgi:hypothetical protein
MNFMEDRATVKVKGDHGRSVEEDEDTGQLAIADGEDVLAMDQGRLVRRTVTRPRPWFQLTGSGLKENPDAGPGPVAATGPRRRPTALAW